MSQYDTLRCSLRKIRRVQFATTVLPSVVVAVIILVITALHSTTFVAYSAFIITLFVFPNLLHHVWMFIIPRYSEVSSKDRLIEEELRLLKKAVDGIYDSFRQRKKGEHFKRAYNLSGKTVADLEEALAVGMNFERREVFVTAFITNGIAVRVTASIGSAFRCAASDDPLRWAQYASQLGCEEIRQYHNHPTHSNQTEPSTTDYKTCQILKHLLQEHASKLRSFIIYWNEIREWRIIEYDEDKRFWMATVFDAAKVYHRN